MTIEVLCDECFRSVLSCVTFASESCLDIITEGVFRDCKNLQEIEISERVYYHSRKIGVRAERMHLL